MENIEDICKIPLPTCCCKTYEGITFDGCHYFVTNPHDCRVMKYSQDFKQIGYFEVCRKYGKICYDFNEKCFWATGWCPCYCIFKLNDCFKEIDRIFVYPGLGGCRNITGLSYDLRTDSLILSFGREIMNVRKDGELRVIRKRTDNSEVHGVLSMNPFFMGLHQTQREQSIRIYDEDSEIVQRYRIPCEYNVKDMVLITRMCEGQKRAFIVLLTAKSSCYPYVLIKEIPLRD